MKTNELIKEIETIIKSTGLELKLKRERGYLAVTLASGYLVAVVSVERIAQMSTNGRGFKMLDYETRLRLLNLLHEYAKTPIEEREG